MTTHTTSASPLVLRALRKTLRALGLAAPLAVACNAHAAPLTNAQFDQGLSGWQTAGDAAALSVTPWGLALGTSPQLVLGTASTWADDDAPQLAGAFNLSGIDPLAAGDAVGLETSLGLSTSAFGLAAFEGSSARQTFDVQAGERITFNWRLLTTDNGTRIDEPDAAWLVWHQGTPMQTGTAHMLGNIATLTMHSDGAAWLDSGLLQYSFVATQSGPLTLGWAISDVGSFGSTSLLLIDDVTVSAVPEAESLVLLLAGLLTLRAFRTKGSKTCA